MLHVRSFLIHGYFSRASCCRCGQVRAVSFATFDDGTLMLASGAQDMFIRLWAISHARGGKCFVGFCGHSVRVWIDVGR